MANTTASKVLGAAFNVIVGRDKKRHSDDAEEEDDDRLDPFP